MAEKNPSIIRLTENRHHRLCVDNFIMNQNKSGGYSSFEPIRGSKLLEHLNGTELFGKVMIEYEYVECTSSCVTALALYRQRDPEYRTADVSRAIERGVGYILSKQRPDGSWTASWGIAFTYGAFFALEALACAGLSYQNCEAVKRGCDFILRQQLIDGGWGESIDVSSNSLLLFKRKERGCVNFVAVYPYRLVHQDERISHCSICLGFHCTDAG